MTDVFVLLVNPNVNEEDTDVEGVFSTIDKAKLAAFPAHSQPPWRSTPDGLSVNMPDDSFYQIQKFTLH